MKSSPWLTLEKIRQQLSLYVLRNEDRDGLTAQRNDLLGVVVNDDGTASQLVKLPRVRLGGLIARIALREEQFRGTLDARVLFPDFVYLALPAATQTGYDLVLPGQNAPWFEVK